MTLDLLHRAVDGHSLSEAEAEEAMRAVLAGESTPVLLAAFLTALHIKGETVEELAGFARAMRAAALPLPISDAARPLLDTCGTGGTGVSAFNISTVAAFVVAGAGAHVAKHGNRSITSKCGSADVLEALGVRTQIDPKVVARAVEEVGIGFLFAPTFHTATKHAQPVRLELKFRTLFNYLGPLTNPARAEFQVVGTWSEEAAEKIAGALASLGIKRAFVVHGSDGLGELTIAGPSTVFAVKEGRVERLTLAPWDFGVDRHPHDSIAGGDALRNREIAESVLSGEKGAPRDVVLMNAGIALLVAGIAKDSREGAQRAAESIDSGAALRKLEALKKITQAAL